MKFDQVNVQIVNSTKEKNNDSQGSTKMGEKTNLKLNKTYYKALFKLNKLTLKKKDQIKI